jgi:hypothetical protein
MSAWLGYLLALGGLVVLAPLMAWLGHRNGRSIKGGFALAAILLGFGVPIDPPAKHLIEASEGEVKADNDSARATFPSC